MPDSTGFLSDPCNKVSDPTRWVGPPEPDGRVEIVLPNGTAVRAPETISAAALRRVLAALRG